MDDNTTRKACQPTGSRPEPDSPERTMIISWILGVIGVLVLWVAVYESVIAIRSMAWPTTTGRVTRSSLHRFDTVEDHETFGWRFGYEYSVNGSEYRGSRVGLGPQWRTDQRSYMEKLARKYPAGSEVEVRYSPKHPARSVLHPGLNATHLLLPLVGILFLGMAIVAR